MFKIIKISILSLMAVVLFSACNFGNSKSTEEKAENRNQVQEDNNESKRKAPQFKVVTIDREIISLEKSLEENKPMLIYFTASWCPMCAKNWPAISEVYQEYKDVVNFVAISIDPTDDNAVLTKLAAEKDLDFPLVAGNPEVMLKFGVNSQATTIGINKEGYVEFEKVKSVLTAQEYRELLEQLVK